MFRELAINCRNFKGMADCAGRRILIRKGGEAMDALAGSVVTCAYDANGNITEYVDGGGVILSHSKYSSFGRELVYTGSDGFTHRFSTKPYCRKTKMVEFQLRRYRPRCGRWMNRDAIEEDGGLNLYGYVGNGVLMNVDLLGNECFCGEEISAVLAVGPRFQNIFLGQGDYEENEQNYMRPIVRSFAESAFSCNSKLSIAYLCC